MTLTKLLPLPKHASKETRKVYALAHGEYKNCESELDGFACATLAFETMMDYDLSTDEGEGVHLALESARWHFQDKMKMLHGWDIV